MYAGHFATGLVLKAKVPEAPTWGILLGVGVLDLLLGSFMLLGVEPVTLTPGQSPGFSVDHIDWSHSLVTSVMWSILFALLFAQFGKKVMWVMAAAVFSHWALDFVMHPAALWPGSGVHLDLGLSRLLPTGWWFVELGLVGLLLGYYWQRSKTGRSFGGRPTAVVVAVLILHIINSPWLFAL